ncbi:MAG: hypothetical protein RI935_36 [Candidatus Parcubacteria bacterium]|jgi:regulator of sigma E protease
MSVSAIFLFIVILIVLVIVHEFGHFIAAKLTGMRVDEFAFGFPPRLFGKKIGETMYAFNATPLGGYVSIWGENGSDDDKKEDGASHHPRAFGNKSTWAKFFVLSAGVIMNMVLALIIFIGISFGEVNISVDDIEYGSRVKNPSLVVTEVSQESPAYRAGIVPGSILLSIVSQKKVANISSATSAVAFIAANQNAFFDITFLSPDSIKKQVTVAAVYGIVPDKKALGVSLDMVGNVKLTAGEAILLGVERTYKMTELTLVGLTGVLTSLFKGESVLESLSGPVGIAKIVGETSSYGYIALLTLVAVLSINLAIFNALPLPALDGGRILVVLIESVIRKKIPFVYYAWLNTIGFLSLLLLLIVVTIKDIGL